MADVFICYSRKDHAATEKLKQVLEENGISCWMAPSNTTNTYNYEEQISNAISESKLLIFLISRNSAESNTCHSEVIRACALEKSILLIYLEKINLSASLDYFLSCSCPQAIPQAIHLHLDYEQGLKCVKIAVESYLLKAEGKSHSFENVQENINPVVEDTACQQHDIPRVFISHHSHDAGRVAKYVKILESNGVPCWIAPRNIPYGSNYAREIPIAIKSCLCFLIFVSVQSQSSEEIEKEIEIANKFNKKIIPVKLDNCDFSGPYMYHLTHKQWFEAYKNQKDEITKLIYDIKSSCNQQGSLIYDTDKPKESGLMLKETWAFIQAVLSAMLRLAVWCVGVLTITAIVYMLLFDKQIIITINEMINAFIH